MCLKNSHNYSGRLTNFDTAVFLSILRNIWEHVFTEQLRATASKNKSIREGMAATKLTLF